MSYSFSEKCYLTKWEGERDRYGFESLAKVWRFCVRNERGS